jgi:hypothetical protein
MNDLKSIPAVDILSFFYCARKELIYKSREQVGVVFYDENEFSSDQNDKLSWFEPTQFFHWWETTILDTVSFRAYYVLYAEENLDDLKR